MGLLILFLLLFGFYMLGIRPVSSDITGQKAEISLLDQEQVLLQNKINELKSAEDATASGEEPALTAIPLGDSSEALILDLKSIGDNSHARLKDIGFSLSESSTVSAWTGIEANSAAGLNEIKMTAIVEGGYAEIHEWLKQLNDLPRVIAVDSFAFKQPYEFPAPLKPGSILTATVSFTAYYEAEGEIAQATQAE